jgi:hypothetical protein
MEKRIGGVPFRYCWDRNLFTCEALQSRDSLRLDGSVDAQMVLSTRAGSNRARTAEGVMMESSVAEPMGSTRRKKPKQTYAQWTEIS